MRLQPFYRTKDCDVRNFLVGELERCSRSWDCGVAAVAVKKISFLQHQSTFKGEAGSQLSEADKLDKQDKGAPRRTRPGNAYHKSRSRFILHSPVSVSGHWVHCRMDQTRHAASSLLLFSLLLLLYGSCFFPRMESPNLGCTGELLRSV